MLCLKLILIVALASLASADTVELKITLNANKTAFDITGLDEPTERITNGLYARHAQFPWHATIFTTHQQNVWAFCSGALISDEYVATYASLTVRSRETRVLLGSIRFGDGDHIFSNQLIAHPNYRNNERAFNLALVRLNTPVRFNGAVRPIALPPFQLHNARFDNQFAAVSGFGSNGKSIS